MLWPLASVTGRRLGPMSDVQNKTRAVELLQQLGLNEYEAKCFVALTPVRKATAREISSQSDVPRTRVYDATRVLENRGLVEVQHSSPQQFRAVPTTEAIGTLEQTYNSRVDELQQQLESVAEQAEYHTEPVNEVWALSGQQAITSRSRRLIQEAANELIFVVGRGEVEGEILSDLQSSQIDRRVLIGVPTEARKEKLQSRLPGVTVFLSNYEWLTADTTSEDSAAINRMLLADRSSFLIGSSTVDTDSTDEQAVFGRGFNNGLVVIARWLLLSGLAPGESN